MTYPGGTSQVEFLGSGAIGVSHGEMKKGEGWASATIRFPLPDEALGDLLGYLSGHEAVEEELIHPLRSGIGTFAEQDIQVSIGGEIVESFLQEAQEVLGGDLLEGRDLMVTVMVGAPLEVAIHSRITAYSVDRWQGIPWDEVSGFRTSVDRP